MLLSQRSEMPQLRYLGQIGDDSDATCSGPSEGVLVIRRSAGPQMLLSQRPEMPQLQQLGFRASDNDATCSGAFPKAYTNTSKEGSASFAKLAPL